MIAGGAPPLVPWSAAFVAAAGMAAAGATPAAQWAIVGLLGALALAWAFAGRGGLGVVLALPLVFGLGLARVGGSSGPSDTLAGLHDAGPVEVHGVISADPVQRSRSLELRVELEAVQAGAERLPVSATVLLRAPLGSAIRYGDAIRASASLRPTTAEDASGFETYLAERGVGATGSAQRLEVTAQDRASAARAALIDARHALDAELERALDDPLAGLAQGIATGRRDALDPLLRDDLNATGLSHLVVISGSNVALLAMLLLWFLAPLLGRRRALIPVLAAVGAYTVFVGADAPVVRAAIMAALLLTASALGRRTSALPAITLAAALMVAVEPGVIRDLSFQLSFAATLALAALAPGLGERLAGGRGGLVRSLADLVAINVAATAATLPLIAMHFDRIPLVALPANLLVVPVFPLMFLGSFVTALAGLIADGVGDVAGWFLAWISLRWFVVVAEAAADLPGASIAVHDFGAVHAALIYGALAALAFVLARPRTPAPAARRITTPIWLLWTLALIPAVALVWASAAEGGDDKLRIRVFDVGQGDAALVTSPDGHTLLIDGGPDADAILRELGVALPAGRRSLDAVLASHPQADHIDGLFAVLERYDVDLLLVSPLNDAAEGGRRLRATAERLGVPVRALEQGDALALGPEVVADVLWPPPGLESGDPNDSGVVMRLRHRAVEAVFTADIGATQELALAATDFDLRADLLKVPHHGSAGSTTDLLLRRVQPAFAVISAGPDNPFGHPDAGVLRRLDGAIVLTTAEQGTLVFTSNGRTLELRAGG